MCNKVLDNGSTRDFLNSDVAAELGTVELVNVSDTITVGTIGGSRRHFEAEEVHFITEKALVQ